MNVMMSFSERNWADVLAKRENPMNACLLAIINFCPFLYIYLSIYFLRTHFLDIFMDHFGTSRPPHTKKGTKDAHLMPLRRHKLMIYVSLLTKCSSLFISPNTFDYCCEPGLE
jgi:hypothetical protein